MSFMEEEILAKDDVWEIDGDSGIGYVPSDVVPIPYWLIRNIHIDNEGEIGRILSKELGDYYEGGPDSIHTFRVRHGYLGRYQAPGYMDCTAWHFGTNLRELRKELRDMYGDQE